MVDNRTIGVFEKKKFIENQKKLLSNLSSRKPVKIHSEEEIFLYYFIEYALSKNIYSLIKDLHDMIDALRMDVYRLDREGIFSEGELLLYISTLNNSMFNLVHSFLIPDDNSHHNYEDLGQFLWYAGTFRDFFKDLESGYINISQEDFNNYNVDITNLYNDENLRFWIKDKVPVVLNLLNNDILILRSMPLKIRFFWSIAYPFYLHKILRIKTYGYTYNYLSKIDFIKEVKTYLETLLSGTKALFKILV
jgi:hypothetical protein